MAAMTDARPRRRRATAFPVAATALAVFLAVLALLAANVRAGRDPALGPGQVAQTPVPARRVIVRRVIVTRVVGDPPASPARASAPAPAPAPAPTAAPPAPVRTAAPAPAPAPAPVVTRAS
jgi:hypothetical protein